jgi:hypothetical protein
VFIRAVHSLVAKAACPAVTNGHVGGDLIIAGNPASRRRVEALVDPQQTNKGELDYYVVLKWQ